MNVANHESGKPLASLEWLISHHESKRANRMGIVSRWPIKAGSTFLDVATGPGFWVPMIREKIGPTGSIQGVDVAEDLIKQAKIRNPNYDGVANFEVQQCNMEELPFDDSSFDVVYAGNCYSYSSNPSCLIEQHAKLVTERGYYIVRQWDNTATVFSHVNAALLHEILFAACSSQASINNFDNYLGRNLLQAFESSGLENYTISTDAVQLTGPLTLHEENYLRLKALWFAEQARDNVKDETLEEWISFFEPASSNYILNRNDFYFCTLEMQVIWKKL